MKILVTGGAGYIGSVLTGKLLELGHEVTVVDNFRHGYQGIVHLATHPNLEVIKRNILDPDRDYLQNKDFIFHLAAITNNKDCDDNKIEAFKVNATVLDNLAYDACKTPILYTSTTAIYGDRGGEFVDEDTDVLSSANSIYSQSKLAGERILNKYDNKIILRLATIYGVSPLMRPHSIVNDFVRMAVQDGTVIIYDRNTSRPYMNILNCVDGLIFAMENADRLIGSTYNFTAFNATKTHIIIRIKKIIDFEYYYSFIQSDYIQDYQADFTTFLHLGFKYKYDFPVAIHYLIRLFSFYD